MAEVTSRDGAWTFDGEAVRIVPGHDRSVHKLRKALGEVVVPLQAIRGVAYEPGRKGGRLRLRLRDGADPFSQAVAGGLPGPADPYSLVVGSDRTGAAEFFVDDVRNSLQVWEVPEGPCDRYLMPGPGVPLTAAAGDGSASFDGERVRLEWNWLASGAKTAAGPQTFELKDVVGVEWGRQVGMGYGYLRFRLRTPAPERSPEEDPRALSWGIQKEGGTTALLAAAVLARLPHPSAPAVPEPAPAGANTSAQDDPDAMLRRLRELGELHREGVLTDEEFTVAKRTLLGM
ncbi:hypothetical protein Acsp03_25600 [Actinomadura sp. NBRC 104412]|uniref:DUF4429 domain-containing protein n=1 Tax=Actinomadura sp. NBRC 104412 TaxID=3032203 RepID=UPI0024A5746E|nr:DUF4429 domain-containing protein [Actinomadura sp. NBRC 104412]GLZ05094.1 hypothetical protein Acsp03_25600 [Actinomadura sp. NBRC 104412]